MKIRSVWTMFALGALALTPGSAISQWGVPKNITYEKSVLEPSVRSIARDGDYLFAANQDIFVSMDISDPANPVLLDSLIWVDDRYDFCYAMVVGYPYLYAATSNSGVFIVDISNPENMAFVDTIQVPASDGLTYISIWNEHLLVAEMIYLFTYNIANPLNALLESTTFIGSSGFNGQRAALFVAGDSILVVTNDTLRLGRLRPDGTIEDNRTLNLDFAIEQILLHNSYLYANRGDALETYKLGPDDALTFCSSVETAPTISEMQIHDGLLYVMGAGTGIAIFDLRNPEIPELFAYYNRYSDWKIFHQFIPIGDLLYLSASAGGLLILRTNLPTVSATALPAPSSLSLAPAYPNPVSGSTSISYSLPAQEHITLEVYNMLGQKVQTLYNGIREPGNHTARLDASALPAGMYRVALRSGEGVKSQMVIVR